MRLSSPVSWRGGNGFDRSTRTLWGTSRYQPSVSTTRTPLPSFTRKDDAAASAARADSNTSAARERGGRRLRPTSHTATGFRDSALNYAVVGVTSPFQLIDLGCRGFECNGLVTSIEDGDHLC